MIDCENCRRPFSPEASRWLCPACGAKNSCCEGEPQPAAGRASDFELIRDGLLRLDPDTRAEVIAAMKALRATPTHVAVRILAQAAIRAALTSPRLLAGSGS